LQAFNLIEPLYVAWVRVSRGMEIEFLHYAM